MKTPHKHAEAIKAWADGASIQIRNVYTGEWGNVSDPIWFPDAEYRVKPEPKPDYIKYTNIYGDGAGCFYDSDIETHNRQAEGRVVRGRIKLTFDGETGKLKSAEVL